MIIKKLIKHNGIVVGDIVKLNEESFSRFKRARVKSIYKADDNIRFVVKTSSGQLLDIHSNNVDCGEACKCEVMVLMRLGCQCGGI